MTGATTWTDECRSYALNMMYRLSGVQKSVGSMSGRLICKQQFI